MVQKSKETEDLLYSTNNQITVEKTLAQFNDILNLFNAAQNLQLQLGEGEDGTDTWFEDVDKQVIEFKQKNWLREQPIRLKQIILCFEEVLLFFLLRKGKEYQSQGIEEKTKLAELQAKIKQQRAENQADTLKVHEEMAGDKARTEV